MKYSLTKAPVFAGEVECVCVWRVVCGEEETCDACVYLPCEVFARSEVPATSDLADLKFRK